MCCVRLVRVIGRDDVGMFQPSGGLYLPLEPTRAFWILGHGGGQDLEGDDAVHPLMSGLEHHPHAALSKLVKNDVITHDERFPLTAENLLSLIGGEFLLLHQQSSQLFAVARWPL